MVDPTSDDASHAQATLHPPPSPKTTMMRGIYMAYVVILIAYFPVAICGYLAFGSSVDPDVLLSVGKPAWLTRAANFMVVVHVGASWQVWTGWLCPWHTIVGWWREGCEVWARRQLDPSRSADHVQVR